MVEEIQAYKSKSGRIFSSELQASSDDLRHALVGIDGILEWIIDKNMVIGNSPKERLTLVKNRINALIRVNNKTKSTRSLIGKAPSS